MAYDENFLRRTYGQGQMDAQTQQMNVLRMDAQKQNMAQQQQQFTQEQQLANTQRLLAGVRQVKLNPQLLPQLADELSSAGILNPEAVPQIIEASRTDPQGFLQSLNNLEGQLAMALGESPAIEPNTAPKTNYAERERLVAKYGEASPQVQTFDSYVRAPTVRDVGGVPTAIGAGGERPLSSVAQEASGQAQIAGAVSQAQQTGRSGGIKLTPGQEKVDENFAKTYNEWTASGGFADVEKNTSQLDNVVRRLESGEKLTGGFIGDQPRFMLARTNPDALDALEQVEEVVQRNLRLILGAQFTEKEGERLIARAYNPRLSPDRNAKRLRRLMRSLVDAAKAKQAAADYFNQNGTLAGWKGSVPSFGDISAGLDAEEPLPEGVSEEDVRFTMEKYGLSREEVLERLRAR